MFYLIRPTNTFIQAFLEKQKELEFSYQAIGATHPEHLAPPKAYTLDHHHVYLGKGEAVFKEAVARLKTWHVYSTGWTFIYPEAKNIRETMTAALLVRHFGFYSLHSLRIVYVLDQPKRFAFAIGTLPAHAEEGEERFMVERQGDDTVWYELLAFSGPAHPLAKLGYFVARELQKRFARDSLKALSKG